MAVLRVATAVGIVAGILALSTASAVLQSLGSGRTSGAQADTFSGPPEAPRRHARVADPAGLSPSEAEAVYAQLRAALAAGYARSGDPTAAAYSGWTRYNTAPYRSATHGRRYVNNYANAAAAGYGAEPPALPLPQGAVVAKDSFTVTAAGDIAPGPLFVMEKMAPGFNYLTGDWRYAMVSADGELVGRTGGPDAERVEFCISCHLAREAQDHLYFVPPAYRR